MKNAQHFHNFISHAVNGKVRQLCKDNFARAGISSDAATLGELPQTPNPLHNGNCHTLGDAGIALFGEVIADLC